MQSRFKFRLWDAENNEWLWTSEPDVIPYNGFHLFGECMLFQNVNISKLSNCVIEQFTGLKDSKDNDIYEGDVLHFVSDDDSYEPDKYFVEWYERWFVGRWSQRTIDNLGEVDWLDFSKNGVLNDMIIIGNIHENPELI